MLLDTVFIRLWVLHACKYLNKVSVHIMNKDNSNFNNDVVFVIYVFFFQVSFLFPMN